MEVRRIPNAWETALAAAQVGTAPLDIRARVSPSGRRWSAVVTVDHYATWLARWNLRSEQEAARRALTAIHSFVEYGIPPAHGRIWLDDACRTEKRTMATSNRHVASWRLLDLFEGGRHTYHPLVDTDLLVRPGEPRPTVAGPMHDRLREESQRVGRTVVLCDGSYRPDEGTLGWAWSDGERQHAEGHRSPMASSNVAEHLAVVNAAKMAAPGRPITLVNDNVAVVRSLGPTFTAAGRSVRLVWAPGHCHRDHNVVDRLAHQAAADAAHTTATASELAAA